MPFPDTPAHQRAADARYALTSLTHSPASPFIDPGPVAFIDLLKCGLWMRVGFVGAIRRQRVPHCCSKAVPGR
jgi:hypothetical protein